jgi:hypothetical protein
MLYLLLSLAQQIQRMRSEMAFISEETKDLRLYSSKMEEELGRVRMYSWERNGGDSGRAAPEFGPTSWTRNPGVNELRWDQGREHIAETSPGRVVLGRAGWSWERWIIHPT